MWSRFQRQNGSVGHVCGSVCIIYNQMHIPTLVNTQKSIYTYPCRAILTFIFVKKWKKNVWIKITDQLSFNWEFLLFKKKSNKIIWKYATYC